MPSAPSRRQGVHNAIFQWDQRERGSSLGPFSGDFEDTF